MLGNGTEYPEAPRSPISHQLLQVCQKCHSPVVIQIYVCLMRARLVCAATKDDQGDLLSLILRTHLLPFLLASDYVLISLQLLFFLTLFVGLQYSMWREQGSTAGDAEVSLSTVQTGASVSSGSRP